MYLYYGGGKSGQRRAPHHVTRGASQRRSTESVTENYRLYGNMKVRVKMWGKSPQVQTAMPASDKPCGLKCHVYPDFP